MPSPTAELEFRDYLGALRRRSRTIVITTAVVVTLSLVLSLRSDAVYSARASILVQQSPGKDVLNDPEGYVEASRQLENEVTFLESGAVTEAAVKRLGFSAAVSVTSADSADLITVTARDGDANRAAEIANTYAETYIDLRRQNAVDDYLATAQTVQERIDEVADRITELEAPIEAIDAELASGPSTARRAELEAQRHDLERETGPRRDALKKQQSFYEERAENLELTADLIQTGGARVITEAAAQDGPVAPTPVRSAILAGFLGLLLGLGIAFLREYLDDTLSTKDDLEQAAPGLTVLGVVPRVRGWKAKAAPRLLSVEEPDSPVAEAYRSLRTSLQIVGLDRSLRLLQVTSARSSDGKTTTAANIAVAYSRAGYSVLVVCCDLRRPRIHEYFGLDNHIGFTSLLLGEATIRSAMQPVPGVDRLKLLASGETPPNPSEVLASAAAAQLFTVLRDEADVVIVDCPPVLPVSDALLIAKHADATILVASAATTKAEVRRAYEQLRHASAPLVGSVLNGAAVGGSQGYQYRYGYSQERADSPVAR